MRWLSAPEELEEARCWMDEAIRAAQQSKCLRNYCGAVIVGPGHQELGRGYNSPPKDCRLKHCLKDNLAPGFKSDKTCCMHAEQRAIMSALSQGHQLEHSRLYFARTDVQGQLIHAGDPYCTICSKMALDSGLEEFVLWHDQGICIYQTEEYNRISFDYGKSGS